MSEFSAHRVNVAEGEKVVIATNLNVYVSPYGDDVLNTGVDQDSPFRTPHKAIQYLSDKIISEAGFVTINFASGIYDIEDTILFDHPQGERVAMIGADPEILVLQYVQYYRSYGLTAAGYSGYYSGVTHEIQMSCVRPNDNTGYTILNDSAGTGVVERTEGYGVIIEDYGLAFDEDYNPIYFYGSYPRNPRNNISRQSSILGCHKLTGVTNGIITVQSSIRDDWFAVPIPPGNTAWARMYGNAYYGAQFGGTTADSSEATSNAWLLTASQNGRGHYLSSVPVGYYGTNASSGIILGATSNFSGQTFPMGALSAAGTNNQGFTAQFQYRNISGSLTTSNYSWTGPAGSMMNDFIRFGPNYHEHTVNIAGTGGIGLSANWKSINTNIVTVKILPTVFRRQGTILSIRSGGLRKVQNIFFDGMAMPMYYSLLGGASRITSGYSNKTAIHAVGSKLGEPVDNEPSDLGSGLLYNIGVKDFHVGVYCDRSTAGNLGRVSVSNCSYGVLANNGSAVKTYGSICTGSVYGFCSFNSSALETNRCFSAFSGQSTIEIRMKDAVGSTFDFSENSFIPGQTYETRDGKVKGTVFAWDAVDKLLTVAVRTGVLEGKRRIL